MEPERVRSLLQSFRGLKILVVGDIILDRYVFGRVERISPEAPVPVLEVEREEFRLGGAGNVAANLADLGVETYLCGLLGDDEAANKVKNMLLERGIRDLTIQERGRPTTEKSRMVALSQQLLRVDREVRRPPDPSVLKDILERLEVVVDGIIVSDYAKGVVTGSLMERVKAKGVFVAVDPRPHNRDLYRGVDLMTPNEKEARQMLPIEDLRDLGFSLKDYLGLKTLVITMGPKGMMLFREGREKSFPARAKQVYDVSGAGDTVVAVLTASYLVSGDWELSCELANVCAGIVVGKLGTATVKPHEILENLR
ncbi:rfaE bifunctional protein [Thermocrinis albus DSM 14484]|uniref:RfaE bifunctional protein n=1 Tax=Thermocrinis albus (strain DSM 14484 / JCM 11386 / HI 11/12) TaxID=638303 RepID=D3SPA3_THEAH|nr:PfkB family carbohydrate kinase [Thermocrinis albus]ADC88990.1 rfaE bifunctional protein [Thermocrinis albus DSM 14484]